MNTVNITINGTPLTVPANYTILEAARELGIEIPTLCHMKGKNEIGACRVCMVEVKGARTLVASCVMPVNEGMEIYTNTERAVKSRKKTVELIMSNHNCSCLSCDRSGNCELQDLATAYGIDTLNKYEGSKTETCVDCSSPSIIRDNSKCVLCRRCVAACKSQTGVIGANNRGFDTEVGCAFESKLNNVACINCGQCIVACPTGALREKDQTDDVLAALNDPTKTVVVQTAPATRVALAEAFGHPVGTNAKGKMVTALKRLGFDKVFDTNFSADLTIMEEATEFLDRFQNGGTLPLITSCSPGWIKYCEHFFPEFIPNLSTCKSPQQMFGAVVKTWWAERNGIDPKDIVSVSIMPCVAKKFEVKRDDQSAAGVPDVDYALSTRELAKLIKRAGLVFDNLPESDYDDPLGEGTGAAVIFGATGGVMEAALRTAVDVITGVDNDSYEFTEVRGVDGIKEATYTVGDIELNVCVVSGVGNAKKVLNAVKNGEKNYHFIEVMGCPGGCVNGGGQPVQKNAVHQVMDVAAVRGSALYEEDRNLPQRKSHKNEAVQTLYKEYLGEPNSHKAHEILHTSYVDRSDILK